MKVHDVFNNPFRFRSLFFQKREEIFDLTGFVGLVGYE